MSLIIIVGLIPFISFPLILSHFKFINIIPNKKKQRKLQETVVVVVLAMPRGSNGVSPAPSMSSLTWVDESPAEPMRQAGWEES